MMMNNSFLKTLTLFVLFAIFHVYGVKAQTHADATSQKWKGIDVNTVLNGNYPDDNTLESGYPFLLYNVGTGRFIMQGGDRTMYLYNNGRINAAITESANVNKNSFCARPPEPFGKNWSDANYNTINLTTLMDGSVQPDKGEPKVYDMTWKFQRVEDRSSLGRMSQEPSCW